MGLTDSPLCRCVAGEETSAYVLFECTASATLRHWVPFSWTLMMLELYILGKSETLLKEQGPHNWSVILKANSHIACRAHATPMQFPHRSPAIPCVKSHMPCRAPALLRQCRVLRESPHGSRKYPNCLSNSLTDRLFCSVLLPLFTVAGMDRCEDWYASDNNLRETPRGSRKKPNADR
jgi:hypothetical protein